MLEIERGCGDDVFLTVCIVTKVLAGCYDVKMLSR